MSGTAIVEELPDGSVVAVESIGRSAVLVSREVAGRGIVWSQAYDDDSVLGLVVEEMRRDPAGFDRPILWHPDGSPIR